ncbi:MAG: helix-hairpin-helix domain-containing protein [Bacteroidales bacterium]|nr:helix-hairpin-helix domain-containing protein [Bacteroidales bacterium]
MNRLTEQDLRDRIEVIAGETDAELDFSELIENLRYYQENPLNLNTANYDDLIKIIFLNDMQVFNILAYRESFGAFSTLYELSAIDGLDEATIRNILPFVEIGTVAKTSRISILKLIKKGKHQVIGRYQQILQEKHGYASLPDSVWHSRPGSHYLGTPEKIYTRYGFNAYNKLRIGFTAEKDPGEPLFNNINNDSIRSLIGKPVKKNFDFLSYHMGLYDWGFVKALTIGDYQLRFGQGLTMWSGLAFGKSSAINDTKKSPQGISPYTSSDENRFFRGAATTLRIERLDFTAFYSSNRIDGTQDGSDSLSRDEFYISSLQESGLHRTFSEYAKKDEVVMVVYGGNIGYRGKQFSIGVTGFKTKFENQVDLSGELYNRFYFSGKENLNGGFDYRYLLGKYNLFGEVSYSKNGGYAVLQGFSANLHTRLFITLLYRNYRKDYVNFFSNPFAESNTFNEEGLYAGIKYSLAPGWSLSAYADHFYYPWLRYYTDKPSHGSDYMVQADHIPAKNLSMYFRIKLKQTPVNNTKLEAFTAPVVFTRKQSVRYVVGYEVLPGFFMKDRIEFLTYREDNDYRGTGFLMSHDINWQLPENKVAFYFRFALFDTDSYDERIYAYESDMLYAFSVPAYYYRGSKIYLMLRYKPLSYLTIWARFSHIWLTDRNNFGSGNEMIDGNKKSEMKVQVMFKL